MRIIVLSKSPFSISLLLSQRFSFKCSPLTHLLYVGALFMYIFYIDVINIFSIFQHFTFTINYFQLARKELIIPGPVVQSFVSLTPSLSPQFVNYLSTSKANTLVFFVKKYENPLHPLHCKGFSHFINKK